MNRSGIDIFRENAFLLFFLWQYRQNVESFISVMGSKFPNTALAKFGDIETAAATSAYIETRIFLNEMPWTILNFKKQIVLDLEM